MAPSDDVVLEATGLTKKFGNFYANKNVSLKLRRGTIHAVLGENGAGKSTLMNMLYGMLPPDSGTILVQGVPKSLKTPAIARSCGIGMVHQHFFLAEPLSVLDNAFLGLESLRGSAWKALPPWLRPIDRPKQKELFERAVQNSGFSIDPEKKVEDLEVTGQQSVEISKILLHGATTIILDEPTAVLAPNEIPLFLKKITDLKTQGYSILLISHKLAEVMAVCDEATVLRKGEVVWAGPIQGMAIDQLARLVVGNEFSLSVASDYGPVPLAREAMELDSRRLACKDLRTTRKKATHERGLQSVTLDVFPGEIVGLAGVEGNGQQDFISLLRDPSSAAWKGDLTFEGVSMEGLTTGDLCRRGMAFVHEDRLAQGVLPDSPLWENFLFGNQHLDSLTRLGFLNKKAIVDSVQSSLTTYDVTPCNPYAPIRSLSGGNQQKVVMARALASNPKLLVACHPTRGVDMGAARFIHGRLLEAQRSGMSILVLSSELEELMVLCHRIAVFYCGKIVGIARRPDWSLKTISQWMTTGGGGQ